MASVYRYLQRSAHEQPVIFYSLALGGIGPVLALVIPPIRRTYFGYKPIEPVPVSYPRWNEVAGVKGSWSEQQCQRRRKWCSRYRRQR